MPTFKETALCVASGVDFEPVHGNPFERGMSSLEFMAHATSHKVVPPRL